MKFFIHSFVTIDHNILSVGCTFTYKNKHHFSYSWTFLNVLLDVQYLQAFSINNVAISSNFGEAKGLYDVNTAHLQQLGRVLLEEIAHTI